MVNAVNRDTDMRKNFPAEFERLRQQIEEKVFKNIKQQYKRLGIAKAPVNCMIRFGESFTGMLKELLTEMKVTILLMGTKGSTGFLSHNNTAEMIADSPSPVLCIPCKSAFQFPEELVYFTDLANYEVEIKKVKEYAKQFGAKISVVHFDYGWAKTPEEENALEKIRRSGLKLVSQRAPIDTPLLTHIRKYMRGKKSLACLFHERKSAFKKFFTGSNAEEAPIELALPVLSFQR